jgi:hypothetical protein
MATQSGSIQDRVCPTVYSRILAWRPRFFNASVSEISGEVRDNYSRLLKFDIKASRGERSICSWNTHTDEGNTSTEILVRQAVR